MCCYWWKLNLDTPPESLMPRRSLVWSPYTPADSPAPCQSNQYSVRQLLSCYLSRSILQFCSIQIHNRDLSRVPDEFCFGVNVSHAVFCKAFVDAVEESAEQTSCHPHQHKKRQIYRRPQMTRLISVYTLQKAKKNR